MEFLTFPTHQEAEQKCIVLSSIPMNFATIMDIMSHLKVTFAVKGSDFRITAQIYGPLYVYCTVYVLKLPHDRIMHYLSHAFIMHLRRTPAATQQLAAEGAIVRSTGAPGCALLNTMRTPFEYGHPVQTLFDAVEEEARADQAGQDVKDCSVVKGQMAVLEQENQELKKDNHELKKDIQKLKKEREEIKKISEALKTSEQEKAEMSSDVQKMIKKNVEIEKENEELKKKVETKNNQAIKTLENTVATQNQQIQMLMKEIEDLNKKSTKNNNTVKEIKSLQDEIHELKKTLKYERANHTKALSRQAKSSLTAHASPPPKKHPMEPVAPLDQTEMTRFLQTTMVANYEVCRENPTLGHCILMAVRQKFTIRQPAAARTSYMFEQEMGIEALDSSALLTSKQIAFFLKFHENQSYEMLRLVDAKHNKYVIEAPPAAKKARLGAEKTLPKITQHSMSKGVTPPMQEESMSSSKHKEDSSESCTEKDDSSEFISNTETSYSIMSSSSDTGDDTPTPIIDDDLPVQGASMVFDYNEIQKNSTDSFMLPLEDEYNTMPISSSINHTSKINGVYSWPNK